MHITNSDFKREVVLAVAVQRNDRRSAVADVRPLVHRESDPLAVVVVDVQGDPAVAAEAVEPPRVDELEVDLDQHSVVAALEPETLAAVERDRKALVDVRRELDAVDFAPVILEEAAAVVGNSELEAAAAVDHLDAALEPLVVEHAAAAVDHLDVAPELLVVAADGPVVAPTVAVELVAGPIAAVELVVAPTAAVAIVELVVVEPTAVEQQH